MGNQIYLLHWEGKHFSTNRKGNTTETLGVMASETRPA